MRAAVAGSPTIPKALPSSEVVAQLSRFAQLRRIAVVLFVAYVPGLVAIRALFAAEGAFFAFSVGWLVLVFVFLFRASYALCPSCGSRFFQPNFLWSNCGRPAACIAGRSYELAV
jgi:hypothetical protein